MSDPFGAIDIAVYAALSAAIVGATVLQHPLQDQQPPAVIIGDIDESHKLGGKGASASRGVPLSIVTVTEGEERAPCAAIVFQIEQILDEATLTAPGYTIRPFFENSACAMTEDGLGYVGLSQFKVYALAD